MAVLSSDVIDRVPERLEKVRARIKRAGGDPQSVTIVAVTKGFGPQAVLAAREAGLGDVGENYGQELLGKATSPALSCVAGSVKWHFLGAIQRNKLSKLAPHVYLYQGVSSLHQVTSLSRSRPGAQILLQVDYTGQRQGFLPGEVPSAVEQIAGADVKLGGLMTVAPRGGPGPARQAFGSLAELAKTLGLKELSMGMSDDFEIAVSEGATMLRLGRALFGPRPKQPDVG